MVKQAVILSAGLGMRLRPAYRETPKGLIPIGANTLMGRAVDMLHAFGIRDVVIVTGHLSEQYETFAAKRTGIRLVHNPHYLASSSMYSFFCARPLLTGEVLLLESDLIYEKRALEKILTSPQKDVVLLSGPTGAGDEVYVSAQNGRIDGISKHVTQLSSPLGEWVGICKVSAPLQTAMWAWAEARFRASLRGDYESDCMAEVAQSYAIGYEKIGDLAWSEVDDECQLRRMQHQIYPRVLEHDALYFKPCEGAS